ncbi:hypothetical protein RJ639_044616 [Escallonia herrerae]|uniref:DYW domain-containing protein n=1 Tax=Escallonia herrerae TaxID=1293975 RepID=A0AA89B4W1_9ASTE|nr:hypothetical protein RJ639_044616 [Escallonia herrerae]
MASLSQMLNTTRPPSLLPKYFYQRQQPQPDQPFVPFSQLQQQKLLQFKLISLLHNCTSLTHIKQVHAHTVRKGLGQCCFVLTKLIRMLIKFDASMDPYPLLIFKQVKRPNPFLYTALIRGYAQQGPLSKAVYFYNRMRTDGVSPVSFTFSALLKACTAALDVNLGMQIHCQKCYSVTPSADHYTCMVDILGRAGRLDEAFTLAKSMPGEPHGGVWGALLGACRIHGNPDVAEIAADYLFELEPNGIGNYILLSNIYASAGRWEDVIRVRKLMRGKDLKKIPACSWVEGEKGLLHEFFAGDMTHPRSTEIMHTLEDLMDKLKLCGYWPNLSSLPYNMNDEDKKRILLTHSEKLALAYGLLTTSAALGEADEPLAGHLCREEALLARFLDSFSSAGTVMHRPKSFWSKVPQQQMEPLGVPLADDPPEPAAFLDSAVKGATGRRSLPRQDRNQSLNYTLIMIT